MKPGADIAPLDLQGIAGRFVSDSRGTPLLQCAAFGALAQELKEHRLFKTTKIDQGRVRSPAN
jgi:hypothetical protein